MAQPPIVGGDTPDIGKCDDCGTDKGQRRRALISTTISGHPVRVIAWLCGACEAVRVADRPPSISI